MGILNDAVTNRRNELITLLNRRGIYRASDGRYLMGLSTYDLEMIHIAVINDDLREEQLID